MRPFFIVVLVVGVVAGAKFLVTLRFSPMTPNASIPTFRDRFGGGPVTAPDYQPQKVDCAYPGYPDGAQVILLSAGRGQAISSAAVGGQDVSTTIVSVVVEPGDAPLYVVGTASSAVLWRLSGATGRIRRLVLASTHETTSSALGTRIPIGETGVPRDNVTFLADARCLPAFEKASSAEASFAAGVVKDRVGHPPAVIAARDAVTQFSIPSGTAVATGLWDSAPGRQLETDHLLGFLSTDPLAGRPLDYEAARSFPGGVAQIDPDEVIANVPVERYDVLPGAAGLRQLVASGALAEIGNDQFHIQRELRMPAELSGAHFLLLKGVPPPDGKYDGVCVISEETGRPVSSQNQRARFAADYCG